MPGELFEKLFGKDAELPEEEFEIWDAYGDKVVSSDDPDEEEGSREKEES